MKNKIFTIIFIAILCCFGTFAQTYPLVTIHDVQFVNKDTLASKCKDKGIHIGDTVSLRGVAIMRGDQSTAYTDSKTGKSTAREVYLQDGWGPWSGIDVFTNGTGTVTAPTDIQSLIPGDSVEVTGIISEYNGQTEIITIQKLANGAAFTNSCKYLGSRSAGPKFNTVNLGDINNNKSINQLPTGEPWESCFIEVKNVTVTSVPSGSRTQFIVADAFGNSMTVFDKFEVQRNGTNGNTFKVPHVGDIFTSLQGVLAQYSPSGPSCNSGTYELYPFDSTNYKYGLSAPIFNSVTRSPLVLKSTNNVTVTANVTPFGTRGIKNVILYYKTGSDTSVFTGYTPVTMTLSGANYVGTIPAMPNGTMVKYYVTAVDTISLKALRSWSPSINTPGIAPYFYTVRDNGLTIYDLQFRPFPAGLSAYNGNRVVVSGVVTASIKDLGYFYIQQPGLKAWAGINLKGSTQLVSFNTGDYVTVGGTVSETNSYTSISVDSIGKASGSYQISPITVPDSLLVTGDLKNRKYMQMLTTIKPIGSKLNVIQLNADGASNFGDFRVGEDISKPTIGTRVTAGNNNANDPGSLNFPYVNDTIWVINLKTKNHRILTTSDNMDSITGIMLYNFSNYKLMPRTVADVYNITKPVAGIKINGYPESSVTLYPNPSNGLFHLEFPENAHPAMVKIRIFDITGREVYANTVRNSGIQDIALNVKPGAYFMILTTDGATTQTKLLIQ